MRITLFSILIFVFSCGTSSQLRAQAPIQLKVLATGELSQGQTGSHFYYNEIHRDFKDWRIGIREVNFLGDINLNSQLTLKTRLRLQRYKGKELEQLELNRAELEWTHPSDKFSVSAGRILIPFGSFYDQQLPVDQIFVGLPLPYVYYVNVSGEVGYSDALTGSGWFNISGKGDWGLPHLYPGGYNQGINFHWNILSDTVSVDLAVVQSAPITDPSDQSEIRPTIMARLEYNPTYYWTQGISVSHGSFLRSSRNNEVLDNPTQFTQTLLGIDSKLGYTHFELQGELIASWYHLPVFGLTDTAFVRLSNQEIQTENFFSTSGYVSLKGELPFWVGAYLAYRFGFITFGDNPTSDNNSISWDDNTTRHSFGFGYKINRNLFFKSTYIIHNVENRAWELNTWRSSLTIHF